MKKIINIVEDEKDLNELVKSYLEKEGYVVNSFLTFDAAYSHIDEYCDLWILDIMLDDKSGFDLIEIIKAISISKNGKVHLILSDGTYLTHQDDTKVMTAKYFEESDIPYSAADFLDGRQKTFIHEGRFYAVEAVSTSNWFIVAEGPVSDFTGNIIQGIIIFELALFVQIGRASCRERV